MKKLVPCAESTLICNLHWTQFSFNVLLKITGEYSSLLLAVMEDWEIIDPSELYCNNIKTQLAYGVNISNLTVTSVLPSAMSKGSLI